MFQARTEVLLQGGIVQELNLIGLHACQLQREELLVLGHLKGTKDMIGDGAVAAG